MNFSLESELLGMLIDVDDILTSLVMSFVDPMCALKLARARHIFNVCFKHSANDTEKSKIELFEICILGSDVHGDPHQIHFEITWVCRM